MNWGYRVALRDKNVAYINAYGTFVDAHTLKTVNKRGKETTITADKIILAPGGRPRYPDIPGAKEYGLSSDDLFSLPTDPGRTLVVGASYVALECAGFLTAFGRGERLKTCDRDSRDWSPDAYHVVADTTVMVRSILLRGFDTEIAQRIGDYMALTGTKFLRSATPSKIEKLESGKLKVTYEVDGQEASDEYDTVR